MNTRFAIIVGLGFLATINSSAQGRFHGGDGQWRNQVIKQRPNIPQGPLTTPAPLQQPPSINPVYNQMTTVNRFQQPGQRRYYNQSKQWNNAGKTSVYYPYGYYYPNNYNYYPTNAYGVPYNPYAQYANVYFVCYFVDQANADSHHISCPYRTAWYSTSPEYDTYAYRTNYLPEYVCPKNNAPSYQEFGTINEADDWSRANCNQWIPNQ